MFRTIKASSGEIKTGIIIVYSINATKYLRLGVINYVLPPSIIYLH